jgi:hypothetical protein
VLLTEDIYLAAFALVSGGDLLDVHVRGTNGRRMAFFQIDGAGMAQVEKAYYGGSATVDLQRLKAQVRRLKDRAFDALREERRDASQSGRYRRSEAPERPRGGRHRAWD